MLDRWHLVAPPSDNPSEGFQMHLVARQDIPEGQEILLSYGDRNNDDFFLHYGFVPLRNPHDDAVLFQDLTDALDWHYEHFKPEVRRAVLYCAALCCAALCCAVLCCAVLCCAVLCCAVLHCAVLHFVARCCPVLCCAVGFSKIVQRHHLQQLLRHSLP